MRALVTHARRLRWLTVQSEDPMWMVRYAKTATIQGAASVYLPRSALPTDEQCTALFGPWRLSGTGAGRSPCVCATGLGCAGSNSSPSKPTTSSSNRPGWCMCAERSSSRPWGRPGSRRPRTARSARRSFPRATCEGPEGLLFASASGQIMRRSNFQPVWIRAADGARWPMTAPLRRTGGHRETNKGWRWTGAAKWSPHDLRHVAACWMLFDLGLDPAVVADKFGHADPTSPSSATSACAAAPTPAPWR
jgi:hypothetical protein